MITTLRSIMSLCNNANLIRVRTSTTRPQVQSTSIGDGFRTAVGFRKQRKGRLPPPTLFNIFLGRIMTEELEDHKGTKLKKKMK